MKPFLAIAFLAACVAPLDMDTKTGDWISMYTLIVFSGEETRRIYDDDTLVTQIRTNFSKPAKTTLANVPAGTYARARAVIENGFPNVTTAPSGGAGPVYACPEDSGKFSISTSLPVNGEESVTYTCNQNGVLEMAAELNALIVDGK